MAVCELHELGVVEAAASGPVLFFKVVSLVLYDIGWPGITFVKSVALLVGTRLVGCT